VHYVRVHLLPLEHLQQHALQEGRQHPPRRAAAAPAALVILLDRRRRERRGAAAPAAAAGGRGARPLGAGRVVVVVRLWSRLRFAAVVIAVILGVRRVGRIVINDELRLAPPLLPAEAAAAAAAALLVPFLAAFFVGVVAGARRRGLDRGRPLVVGAGLDAWGAPGGGDCGLDVSDACIMVLVRASTVL
jgi:hypothetical protein